MPDGGWRVPPRGGERGGERGPSGGRLERSIDPRFVVLTGWWCAGKTTLREELQGSGTPPHRSLDAARRGDPDGPSDRLAEHLDPHVRRFESPQALAEYYVRLYAVATEELRACLRAADPGTAPRVVWEVPPAFLALAELPGVTLWVHAPRAARARRLADRVGTSLAAADELCRLQMAAFPRTALRTRPAIVARDFSEAASRAREALRGEEARTRGGGDGLGARP